MVSGVTILGLILAGLSAVSASGTQTYFLVNHSPGAADSQSLAPLLHRGQSDNTVDECDERCSQILGLTNLYRYFSHSLVLHSFCESTPGVPYFL